MSRYALIFECQWKILKTKKEGGGGGTDEKRAQKVVLSLRKWERERTLCHLVGIPSGCFYFQDIDCVSGKPPASRETYWITDNLGIDTASTRGV